MAEPRISSTACSDHSTVLTGAYPHADQDDEPRPLEGARRNSVHRVLLMLAAALLLAAALFPAATLAEERDSKAVEIAQGVPDSVFTSPEPVASE